MYTLQPVGGRNGMLLLMSLVQGFKDLFLCIHFQIQQYSCTVNYFTIFIIIIIVIFLHLIYIC